MMRKRGHGISMSERLHSTSEPQSRPHSQPSLQLPPHRQSRSERLPQSHRQSSQATSQATVSTPLSNDSGASMCGTSNNRKGRGSARSLSIWGTGEQLHINFNEMMQPIGLNATKLTSQLGYIARDSHRVPLTYVSWSSKYIFCFFVFHSPFWVFVFLLFDFVMGGGAVVLMGMVLMMPLLLCGGGHDYGKAIGICMDTNDWLKLLHKV
ncbi:hypothetical protein QJS04_geneDACA013799 [Acorus gramineus]|uniref:Uncharacterized protein n=1 Tax=Acorus gramineus TaxID=55184 RepID=A0AAV9AV64_ACOGR|nr:hypothetical protein QJS04_geneDACA013799 [Acorus gramineus]